VIRPKIFWGRKAKESREKNNKNAIGFLYQNVFVITQKNNLTFIWSSNKKGHDTKDQRLKTKDQKMTNSQSLKKWFSNVR
jgi:hypothetical protein